MSLSQEKKVSPDGCRCADGLKTVVRKKTSVFKACQENVGM